jgi:elongation factor P
MRPASELRARMVIRVEETLYRVIAADYHGGQGKMGGVMHAKLRDLRTGAARDRSFRADQTVEDLETDRMNVQFLYADGDVSYFMNPQTFEQIAIDTERLGKAAAWLNEETTVPLELFEGEPLDIVFPEVAEACVTETPPAFHQPGKDNVWKDATLDNGLKVMVPPFIEVGEQIRVEVESGRYVERAKARGR